MNSFMRMSVVFLLMTIFHMPSIGQANIQEQFDEFYSKKTNAWEAYRMVKTPGLKEFWAVVSDTLTDQRTAIAMANKKTASLRTELSALQTEHERALVTLEQSEKSNNSMGLLGLEMTKSSYNLIMWLIILSLALGSVFMYLLYKRNLSITSKAKVDYEKLQEEFLEHKNTARDSQSKVKRELQTALNTISEHRLG